MSALCQPHGAVLQCDPLHDCDRVRMDSLGENSGVRGPRIEGRSNQPRSGFGSSTGAGAGGGGSSFVVLQAESPSTIAIAKSARMDLLVLLTSVSCVLVRMKVGLKGQRLNEGQDHPTGILWSTIGEYPAFKSNCQDESRRSLPGARRRLCKKTGRSVPFRAPLGAAIDAWRSESAQSAKHGAQPMGDHADRSSIY